MYTDIAAIYAQLFPVNDTVIHFLNSYLKPRSRVLDLACGPGHHAAKLSKLGHTVTGIDASAGMITKAKASGTGDFQVLQFKELRTLTGPFDCIYSIGNSLSYLKPEHTPGVWTSIATLLKDEGRFILQTVNWDKILDEGEHIFPVKALDEPTDAGTNSKDGPVRRSSKFRDEEGPGRRSFAFRDEDASVTFHREYQIKNANEVIFLTYIKKGGNILQKWQDTLYPKRADEITRQLALLGLSLKTNFGDFNKNPYNTAKSGANIMVFEKKELKAF